MLSRGLWGNGAFVRFFIGASLSIVGDWFNTVAIAVLTYRITGQVSLVAVAILAAVVPRVLLAPIGGALADRFERRSLLVALDSARALIALLPLFAHNMGTLWLSYATVVLLQIGSCVYNPAQSAYVSHLVPDDLLEPANAAYATMRDIGIFIGPALAATVLGVWGSNVAFWSNALSFVIAAGLLLTLPRAVHSVVQISTLRALVTGHVVIVRRYPRIAALYLCYLACTIPIYFFQAIMVAYAKSLGQPSTFLGVLYAAAGLGGAIGGIAMGQYMRRLPYAVAISVYTLSAPLLGALVLVHHPILALVLLACSTAAGTAGDLIFTVSVQRHVAPHERGRAFGMLFWCIAIGQLIGAGLGVTLASQAVPAMLWISVGVFPIVLTGVFLSIRAGQPMRGVASPATAEVL